MIRPRTSSACLHDEQGFTLIELIIAMAMGIVVTLAAFSFLGFATGDVARITERVHVDQTGRVALEKIMLELHSTCVTPSIAPIKEKSTENVIKFVSESGTSSALGTVDLHVITYTPPVGTTKGTLVESIYPSTSSKSAPKYSFATTATSTTKLLTGVKQSESKEGKAVPIFQYFRYYREGDSIPTGYKSLPYGELDPKAMGSAELATEAEANNVAKVTISFTLAPEGAEATTFNHDRPVPLEDSAVFRLAPSSESSSNPNLPCSPET
jgi:prepilin-type N-terminal cleavage/methylation domain-containing protein